MDGDHGGGFPFLAAAQCLSTKAGTLGNRNEAC